MGVQLAGGPRSVVFGVRCTGMGVYDIKNHIFCFIICVYAKNIVSLQRFMENQNSII